MADWRAMLDQNRVLISDGAWGTELARRGMDPGQAPERLNLERPDLVREIAASYVAVGSDIVLTNTFGGSPLKLDKVGLGDSTFEVNRIGAELSSAAAEGRALVFASVGPTGEFMAPLGVVTEDQMVRNFARQVEGLVAGGADGIVVETMTDLGEAKAALRAAKDNSDLPVVVSMSFDKGPSGIPKETGRGPRGPAGYATMMGVRPEQAAAELEAAGADIVGSNCGQGIENLIEVAAIMRAATALPLWIKPNAGLPELVGGRTVYRETPESMAGRFPALVQAGASIIGGCCGTTPDHIRLLVAEREKLAG